MTGFFTSGDDLGDIASSVDDIESDVRSIRETWNSGTGDGAATFATVECGAAFSDVRSGIAALLHDRAVKCADLAGSIREGRSAYERVEDAVSEAIDRVVPDRISDLLGGN
ncbi:hypothetical protein AB8O38_21920 [Saccharomonospora xinjiangensis]|uniref:hypothetical protein n=1 Tax=Saccharomonospora xinjiangensis TaxID=75294 RepID=UPI00350F93F1